ncbi:MAG: nucleotide exchange factor GrpE [Rhodoplanes sp.]|jgi:molecular chaperone GrpE
MTENKARSPESADGETNAASARTRMAEPKEYAAAAGFEESAGAEQADAAQALAAEAADLKDRLLRTLAEMENLRRRTEREVADARVYGIAVFARDMLAVADNLRRALDAIAGEGRESLSPVMTSFVEGVELTERELLKVLEKHGVKRFDPLGEKFDPNVHQAMFEVPDPSSPAGTVVRVVQAGFMIGERVLRPALVGVARGGPKAAPRETGQANDNSAGEEEPQGTI